jgi:hypothetical protein
MSPAMALRTDLPAALTEPRSVARSPDRNPKSPITAMAPAQSFPVAAPVAAQSAAGSEQVEAEAPTTTQPENSTATEVPTGQTVSTPSGPMHSSSGSTVTVTPQTVNQEIISDALAGQEQETEPVVPRGQPAP